MITVHVPSLSERLSRNADALSSRIALVNEGGRVPISYLRALHRDLLQMSSLALELEAAAHGSPTFVVSS